MFEVEKKFSLEPGDEERLIAGTTFVGEKIIHDVYYDVPDFSLSTKEWWLRCRDSSWELKIPQHVIGYRNHVIDQFEEVEDESEIRSRLGLPQEGDFLTVITGLGYAPIADIRTTRRKYRLAPFTIDIDSMDYGYALAEIELMVDSAADMPEAAERIEQFARERGLAYRFILGKVLEYLRRMRPAHYRAMQDAGIC